MLYNLDGFDTTAVSNAPNEIISSKNQLVMLVFTLRTYGKCIRYG